MSKRYQGGVLGVGFNPLRAPNAPTVGTATGGNASATVAFTAPACVGGSAVTRYTARSTPGNFSGAATGSPITISGLTNGTPYTFGVFALNSYGPSPISAFSNSVTPSLDGTFAIFALGGISGGRVATRDKYTYSGDVVSAGGAATVASCAGSAAGNSVVGIFALGGTPARSATRNKYTYVGCVVSVGGAATSTSSYGTAAGNSTTGVFALGSLNCGSSGSRTRNKYTYSGCVVASGTLSSINSISGSAAGTSTFGVFAIGSSTCGCASYPTTTRDKYTYSSCVVSAGGAATLASRQGSAAGNSTVGIFALGQNGCFVRTTTRNKYTYSGDVVSAGGASTVGSFAGSAAGNSVVGIFALGDTCAEPFGGTTRNKYAYSSDVVSSATAATAASRYGSAASNGTAGVNV